MSIPIFPRGAIVGGSSVFDNIARYPGAFISHILKDEEHINVSFTASSLRSSWGGTGGNISYNLAGLGVKAILLSALGNNGKSYLEHLRSAGVVTDFVAIDESQLSASCAIATDMVNDQINYFWPGPTNAALSIDMAEVLRAHPDTCLAIISPSTRDVMLKQLSESSALGIETIFDPGQQITSFSGEDLRSAVNYSDLIFCNRTEKKLLTHHSGMSKEDILSKVKILVTTLGGEGSLIEREGYDAIEVPACVDIEVEDPTGAGDAFRAGWILGQGRDYLPEVCAQLGSVAASFVVETPGTQDHVFDFEDFITRYERNFGSFPTSLDVEWRLGISVI